jgi:hypothetical protein
VENKTADKWRLLNHTKKQKQTTTEKFSIDISQKLKVK